MAESYVNIADGHIAQEFTLSKGEWILSKHKLSVGEAKYFAPANIRCAGENHLYRQLILEWMDARYTLRYSGGMVPDVHHILTKVLNALLR